MTRKLSPAVDVFGIILSTSTEELVKVVVRASISDYDFDGKVFSETIKQYVEAVCVLSTDKDFDIAAVLNDKWHWDFPTWYEDYTGTDIAVGERIRNPAEDIQFEFDIDSNNIEDLSFFTYIQVDTQLMESDYLIDISSAYKNMAGNYNTGIILVDGEKPSVGNIIDAREAVDTSADDARSEAEAAAEDAAKAAEEAAELAAKAAEEAQ